MSGTSPRFHELLEEIGRLHDAKNHDYAHDADPFRNFRAAERLGASPFLGCLIRASDKWERIANLVRYNDPAVKSESIRDTLMDLAAYCLIAVALFEEQSR